MPLDPGELVHRITIEYPKYSQNTETGERQTKWSVFVSDIAARVSPLSASEFIAAQSTQSKVSARIKIRYRSGLTAAMRIKHRDAIYNIEGILPDNESGLEWITIPVSSGVNDG
jgi:SPP1 family predicted phage head-tail adaptor